MKSQLVGVIIVAPLFFAISGVLNGIATNEAADDLPQGRSEVDAERRKGHRRMRDEEKEKGAKSFGEKYDSGAEPAERLRIEEQEESEAKNALSEATLRDAATGFGLAGRIGLAVALIYSCLWAMRVGLLSRFWGSLGMALGVAALVLLVQFCLIFFIYFALLLVGKLPARETARLGGGRGGAVAVAGRADREGNRTEGRRAGPRRDDAGVGAPEGPTKRPSRMARWIGLGRRRIVPRMPRAAAALSAASASAAARTD